MYYFKNGIEKIEWPKKSQNLNSIGNFRKVKNEIDKRKSSKIIKIIYTVKHLK